MSEFTGRYTLRPDREGGFRADTFTPLLQTAVHLPGLDPTWRHILIDAQVAGDGDSAELTVRSKASAPLRLDQSLRVVSGPPAHVRVVDGDGATLAEGPHPAPLRVGQEVAVGADHYLVQEVAWPGRHPETQVCAGELDWQVATVIPHTQPTLSPVP